MRKSENEKNFEEKINTAFREENFKEIGDLIGEGIDTAIDVTRSSLNKFINKNKVDLPYSVQNDDRIINQNPKTVKRVKTWGFIAKASIVVHLFALFGFLMDMFDTYGTIREDLPALIFWVIPALVISFYLNYRVKKDKDQIIRFRKYNREIGNNTVIPTADLAAITAKPIDFTINDLLNMIEKDYYRQARIVENGELFILDSNTYKLYKEEMLRDPKERYEEIEEKESNALVEEYLSRAKRDVTALTEMTPKLREPMKAKISEFLQIVGKIFELLKENPNTAKDLDKVINFYLPTTVKLMDNYIDLSEKPTDSVESSLKSMEQTMDLVNDGFMKMLDNIYQEKIMDLSSDMSVLKSMLRQEGLLDQDNFNLGGK
ncbi:MAG: 5-bromo-4-chloroindolyl phosphate hydrolysis family protein [Peptoniphilus grossensis]|uniref:5-bromo-4-chloroindolyl phosphate hydrolysis family protein n=1 Tax=Peptoniphilus grossensis TaxID=1465756 RepID=UPI00258DBB43|nr:5-bromo-4-chloroindolyl phosphate hydrolysis family protein [Peptoniphilus grossensis]MDU5100288.1 5-bromo-4-chloroindolyl phosphate hydrolysis family protein [Peptoniphilus grossensis]